MEFIRFETQVNRIYSGLNDIVNVELHQVTSVQGEECETGKNTFQYIPVLRIWGQELFVG